MGVDLHRGLGRGGERALGALAGGPQAAQGALVAGVEQVLLGLALELRAEVVEEAVVEVLPAEVGVAGGGLDLEDALLDGQQETSKVPPPRSKMTTLRSPAMLDFLSRPYAMAAAVGSLMIRITFSPAMAPASLVAWRCESLKYAGTVTTAFLTVLPR